MKEILNKTQEAYKLAEKLEEILFSIKSDMEWYDIGNLDNYISNEDIKESMIKSIHDHDYEFDINDETNITYENDKEKRKAYYIGVISGYRSAFFGLCSYFDLITFYEDEISPILKKHRIKLIEGNK